MSSNESMEMYLETIFLIEKSEGHAHSVDIAKRLGVSKASVSKAMKHLKEVGYIDKESYGSITLTKKGKELSEKVYNNHKMITAFLKHSLNLTDSEAAVNACKMEHILTDNMICAINIYLKNNNINK